MKFSIYKRRGLARSGVVETKHGQIKTPSFVPVGTQATVKALSPQDLRLIGTQVFIVNTYHLFLRPGEKVVKKLGGLHRFALWDGPLMTDSGGFQIFSLGAGMEHQVGKMSNIFVGEDLDREKKVEKHKKEDSYRLNIDEDGVTFKSHLDGSVLKLTPERSIKIQHELGADIILALDECTSPLHSYEYTKVSTRRTSSWAERSIIAHKKLSEPSGDQSIYAVIQGGRWKGLREESAKKIGMMNFDGFAIGGSLGKSKQEMWKILEWVIPLLPEGKPRHLLGVGEIADIFEVVERGVDTFDAIIPTRLARMGYIFTRDISLANATLSKWKFRVDITNSRFCTDPKPISKTCGCFTCTNGFSRGYLCHLFRTKELLGYRLATIHNLWFYERLMDQIREAIEEGTFESLKKDWLA